MKLRVDASIEMATLKVERFAQLAGEFASAEADRAEALATTNAVADRITTPIVEEMNALREEIAPWWARNGAALVANRRKTVELGGCMIGSKVGRASLTFAGGDDKAALAALQECRWARPYIRTSYAIDKTATSKALDGKHATGLKELGFAMSQPTEQFVLEPVKQAGTIGG